MTLEALTTESIRFAHRGAFARDLDAAVDEYFSRSGRSRRDVPAMYAKTVLILGWFVASWVVLVFVVGNAWQGVLAAMSLGLSIAAVGMCVQHDANHGAFSRHRWVNRTLGATLDLMGVCSFIWRSKHNVGHHTFTNVEGIDYDLDFGALARLSPRQTRRSWHRWQHVYLWFFYGLLLPKWVFHDDFVILVRRHIGVHRLPRPKRSGIAWFALVKVFFISWSFIVPAFFHPVWQVVVFHLLAAFTLGATLGTIFQLAHCNGDVEFPSVTRDAPLTNDWATHQLETTADFAPRSRVITWFCGGLNFQVEHHLFPKICHLHYPALAELVAEAAARNGLRHLSRSTFAGAVGSHLRHLRAMGRSCDEPQSAPLRN